MIFMHSAHINYNKMQNECVIKRRCLSEVRRGLTCSWNEEVDIKNGWKAFLEHFLDLEAGVEKDNGDKTEDEEEEEFIEGLY